MDNALKRNIWKQKNFIFCCRELSLLSKQYREIIVAYYFTGKSCSEISADLGISTEMVKYYLFKTRKILKEGIGMSREFGEKSYNPGTFVWTFGAMEIILVIGSCLRESYAAQTDQRRVISSHEGKLSTPNFPYFRLI